MLLTSAAWALLGLAAAAGQWVRIAETAPWTPRYGLAAFVFNNKLWILGGGGTTGYPGQGFQTDVWCSANGRDWTQKLAAVPWGQRGQFACVAFQGKIWFMGGTDDRNNLFNDVWSSSDGVTWTRRTEHAPWEPRGAFPVVVFQNKLWLMGGAGNAYYHDVWSSTDGVMWTLVQKDAGWMERFGHMATVLNGKMWVMGGMPQGGGAANGDVWSSADGKTWTMATANGGWNAMRATAEAFNGKLWLMGGWADLLHTNLNEVWASTDGKKWTWITQKGAVWSGRFSQASVVFQNRIWVLGGATVNHQIADIWRYHEPNAAMDTGRYE